MIKPFTYGILIILIYGISFSDVNAQFKVLDTPTHEDLTTVFFLNSDIGFTGGNNGVILKTTDGGNHWKFISIENNHRINGITFISPDTGFIVGENNTFYKTTDGGNNWIDINPGLNADFTAIGFVTENTGFAIGHGYQGGIFMKTTDKGKTWDYKFIAAGDKTIGEQDNTHDIDVYLTNFSFYDENSGLIGGFTYDYSIGKFPFICKTVDGGDSFINISPEPTKNDWYVGREIVSLNYMNQNDACAIVNSGLGSEFLLISDYYIDSFEKNDRKSNFDTRGRFFSSVFLGRFIAYFTGIIDGKSQVLKTIDQGESYMFLSPPSDKSLYASFFTDINNGFFVGQDGTVLHLNDENNIVYNPPQSRYGSYFDPPFTIAYTKDNLKKSIIHVYNIDYSNKNNFKIEIYNSQGLNIPVKRSRVRTYSDEIRIWVKTGELDAFTYFYTVKYGKSVVVNGKIDLGAYARSSN